MFGGAGHTGLYFRRAARLQPETDRLERGGKRGLLEEQRGRWQQRKGEWADAWPLGGQTAGGSDLQSRGTLGSELERVGIREGGRLRKRNDGVSILGPRVGDTSSHSAGRGLATWNLVTTDTGCKCVFGNLWFANGYLNHENRFFKKNPG